MIICGSYMFEFSVSKDMEKKMNCDKRRIPTYLFSISSNTNCQRVEC